MSETHQSPSPSGEYGELKMEIDSRFPSGSFVAVESGQVIADAESHRQLVQKLDAMSKSPKIMLIVQAGVEYPKSAIILLNAPDRDSNA